MGKKIEQSIFMAMGILVTAYLISGIENKNLIIATVLTVIGILLLVRAILNANNIKKCFLEGKNHTWHIISALLLILTLGFTVGKLTYLWIQ